jgi:hypothetical protein
VNQWIDRPLLLTVLSYLFFHVLASHVSAEPLSLPNQFLLNSVHLSAAPESAAVVREGTYHFESRGSVTNSFVLEDGYVVDAEQRALELSLRAGASEDLELRATLPLLWRGGGVFDHTIRQWHEIFNLPDGDRDTVANDQYVVEGNTSSGTFAFEDKGFSLGNLSVGVKRQLLGSLGEMGWQAQAGGTLSLPTAREGFGHKGLDGAVTGVLGYLGAGWELSGGASLLLYGDRSINGLSYDAAHVEGFFNAEFELWPGVHALVGLYGGQQSVNNLAGLPGEFLYLDTGLRFEIGDDQNLILLVRENPYPSRESADVTGVLSYTTSFERTQAVTAPLTALRSRGSVLN